MSPVANYQQDRFNRVIVFYLNIINVDLILQQTS